MRWYFGNSFADPRIDKVPLVTGTEGKMTISQAAAKIDPIAYPKLTAQRDRAVRQCYLQRNVYLDYQNLVKHEFFEFRVVDAC